MYIQQMCQWYEVTVKQETFLENESFKMRILIYLCQIRLKLHHLGCVKLLSIH